MNCSELVTLLYEGGKRFQTAEIQYRVTTQPSTPKRLVLSIDATAGGGVRWQDGQPLAPSSTVETRSFWASSPSWFRVEILAGERVRFIGGRNGQAWWTWTPDVGNNAGRRDTLPAILHSPLLMPHLLLSTMLFEVKGSAIRAGRNVVTAEAVPRDPDLRAVADRIDFEFDSHFGVVLRRATHQRDQCVALTEAKEVHFNRVIPNKVFKPGGRGPQSARTIWPSVPITGGE